MRPSLAYRRLPVHDAAGMRPAQARRLGCTAALAITVGGVAGCNGGSTAGSSPSATATVSVAPSVANERAQELVLAEVTRRVELVRDEDLRSPDAAIRRAAVRALARSRDVRTHKALAGALADPDAEVVAWAAYGLGDICDGRREATVRALAAAAASVRVRFAEDASKDDAPDGGKGDVPDHATLSPHVALAHALGRCGTAEAETTLVAVAREQGPGAEAAALAIGHVADLRKRLREDSYVALLSLAEGDATHDPMPAALYPFGRVEHLTPSVIERTRRVAEAALGVAGPHRVFAVAALGRVDDDAVALLAEIAKDGEAYTLAERAAAIRALERFPRAGQKALADIVPALARDPMDLAGPNVPLLLMTMDALTVVDGVMGELKTLAALAPPEGATAPQRRRTSWIRCTAAAIVAERKFDHPLLRACDLAVKEDARATDPLSSPIGARAVVRAIGVDGASIVGQRLVAWRAYAMEGERRSRQAALELLKGHAEIRESAEVLTKALESSEPGYVATAAQILAARPLRAVKRELQRTKNEEEGPAATELHPALVDALLKRLKPEGPTEDLEALGAVIEAVGALRLDEGKPLLLERCHSPWRTIRDEAQQALTLLMGRSAPRCDSGE
ncbi:MAG TPA: peptidylprolyl isomerase, partial [Polyangiaceae bacterium]|nr:peptidylprolyl isomerase [Polyangiaceae bacterium]